MKVLSLLYVSFLIVIDEIFMMANVEFCYSFLSFYSTLSMILLSEDVMTGTKL